MIYISLSCRIEWQDLVLYLDTVKWMTRHSGERCREARIGNEFQIDFHCVFRWEYVHRWNSLQGELPLPLFFFPLLFFSYTFHSYGRNVKFLNRVNNNSQTIYLQRAIRSICENFPAALLAMSLQIIKMAHSHV